MSIDKEREAFIADCKELFGWVSGCSGYDDAATELFNRMQARAALSAPSHSEQVREGWQLVPVKPSIDMVEAGYEASLGHPDRGSYAPNPPSLCRVRRNKKATATVAFTLLLSYPTCITNPRLFNIQSCVSTPIKTGIQRANRRS
jgi:hypothetical protein